MKIEITIEQFMKITKQILNERQNIVDNISYASQISGEDDKQYRDQLERLDQSYNRLLDRIDNFQIIGE